MGGCASREGDGELVDLFFTGCRASRGAADGGQRRMTPPSSPLVRSDSTFDVLAYDAPTDLVAAWIDARERGDIKLATALCAEDLTIEYGDMNQSHACNAEVHGRSTIAERLFATPAPAAAEVLKAPHLIAQQGDASVVAREWINTKGGVRMRQEFTVINLSGWKDLNAMQILRIVVTRAAAGEAERPSTPPSMAPRMLIYSHDARTVIRRW